MKSGRSRILRVLLALGALGVVAALGGAAFFYVWILSDLPDLRRIDDYRPALATSVYDRSGTLIGEFFEERRRLIERSEIPQHVIDAFVAGEDDGFFEHAGIDYRSILRAAWVDLTAGEIVQGASTITQQTVKSLLLTPERRFERKIKEMVLARQLEQQLSKDEILYLYLNQIYFGSGAYGIREAARTYFGKRVDELDVGEAALLAGLPKAPSRFSPRSNPEAAEARRRYVLGRLHELDYIDRATWQQHLDEPPELRPPPESDDFETAQWFTEEVRRLLFDRLEDDQVLRGGLRVETTLDLGLQRSAVAAVRAGLLALDRRQGWSGPVREVEADAIEAELDRVGAENGWTAEDEEPGLDAEGPWLGVVVALDRKEDTATIALAPGVEGTVALEDVAWARPRDLTRYPTKRTAIERVFSVGDVARFSAKTSEEEKEEEEGIAELRLVLHQDPEAEGALFSQDIATGEVLALVGGYDFGRSQFDRAVQARRQPGSAFKPIIYAAALGRGYTPVSTLYDRPLVYTDHESGFTWRPENYGRRFLGPMPLREAIARSVNNATIHLLKDVGVGPVIEFAQRLGIESELARDLSLALGSSPVSLLELTRAYAVFPSGGRLLDPVFVERVLDRDGEVLIENAVLGETGPDPDALPGVAAGEAAVEPSEPAIEPLGGDVGDGTVIDPAHAFVALDLLRGVIEHPRGTGRRAAQLGRPLGGKTGTTNEQGDAWFVGFSADVATGVWVGFDERDVLGRGETGSRAALPIWIDYMRAAHQGRPVNEFPVPAGVSFARVDVATGKLADASSEASYFQPFLDGTEPTESASDVLSASESRRLLRMDF